MDTLSKNKKRTEKAYEYEFGNFIQIDPKDAHKYKQKRPLNEILKHTQPKGDQPNTGTTW